MTMEIGERRDVNGEIACNARKPSGEPCGSIGLANGRCKYHGGMAVVGTANHAYKTGKYSKYLPEKLRTLYEVAESDEELLTLRSEIALLDARLQQVIARVDSGESGSLWENVQQAWGKFEKSRASGSVQGMEIGLAEVKAAITNGHNDMEAWGEIGDTLLKRARLVESERKRMVEAQQMVTVESAMVLVSVLTDSVVRNVKDRGALSRILSDFREATNKENTRRQGREQE